MNVLESTKDSLRRVRWWFSSLAGRDVYHRAQLRCPTVFVGGRPGTGYGGWTVCANRLSSDSVVYSFGIGDEVSFDLDLIDRFGVRVHAFDPTPASQRWLSQQSVPDAFIPHAIGAADFDGTTTFHAPADPAWVSHSIVPTGGRPSGTVEVEVRRIGTIMAELGHDRIDLLKMDIEGAEYGVIADLVERALDIDQILVEFHHRFDSVPPARTAEAVRRLNSVGFRIAHVSPRGEEYTFVRAG
jgi:FkbM family methyltransferase